MQLWNNAGSSFNVAITKNYFVDALSLTSLQMKIDKIMLCLSGNQVSGQPHNDKCQPTVWQQNYSHHGCHMVTVKYITFASELIHT